MDAERERRCLTDCDELDEATLKRNPNNAVITFYNSTTTRCAWKGLAGLEYGTGGKGWRDGGRVWGRPVEGVINQRASRRTRRCRY